MRLKSLALGGRVTVSLFAATMLAALLSAELLVHHTMGGDLSIDSVKAKYAGSLLVSAMHGSMYEYVTEDESIAIVERWVAAGATEQGYEEDGTRDVMEEDCTNCHSKTSTMSDAMPSMPLTTYEEVSKLASRGLPSGKMLMQVHVHAYALGTVLLLLGLLTAFADIGATWKSLLPLLGFLGLWMDTGGWVLGTVGEWAAWLVVIGGGLLAAGVGAMALIVLVDCWFKVPLIGRSPD